MLNLRRLLITLQKAVEVIAAVDVALRCHVVIGGVDGCADGLNKVRSRSATIVLVEVGGLFLIVVDVASFDLVATPAAVHPVVLGAEKLMLSVTFCAVMIFERVDGALDSLRHIASAASFLCVVGQREAVQHALRVSVGSRFRVGGLVHVRVATQQVSAIEMRECV